MRILLISDLHNGHMSYVTIIKYRIVHSDRSYMRTRYYHHDASKRRTIKFVIFNTSSISRVMRWLFFYFIFLFIHQFQINY